MKFCRLLAQSGRWLTSGERPLLTQSGHSLAAQIGGHCYNSIKCRNVLNGVALITNHKGLTRLGSSCFRMERAIQSKYHIATFVNFPSDSTCSLAQRAGKKNAGSGNCDGGTSTTPASDYAASCASIKKTVSRISQSRSVNLAAIAEEYGGRLGAKRTLIGHSAG